MTLRSWRPRELPSSRCCRGSSPIRSMFKVVDRSEPMYLNIYIVTSPWGSASDSGVGACIATSNAQVFNVVLLKEDPSSR